MRRGITGVGGMLCQRRHELGRSQADLAGALEVTQSLISNWEAGRTEPPLSLFLLLCDELNLSAVQVVTQVVTRTAR